MSRYLGNQRGTSVRLSCVAPAVGEFATTTEAPTGSAVGSAVHAKLGGLQVNPDLMWSDEHRIRNGDFGAAILGTGQPPDGFSMIAGVWGTDAELNSGAEKSGKYALRLLATAVATQVRGPLFPVVDGEKIRVGAEWRAALTNVQVTGTVIYYAADQTTVVGSTGTFFVKTATSADVYEVGESALTVPSGGRYARVFVTKTTTSTRVDIDRIWAARSRQGESVGNASILDSAFASFNTSIPFDNTIPTTAEGNNYFSLTYTPRLGGRSTLVVEIDVFAGIRNFADHMVWTVNDGSNTLSADAFYCGTAAKVFHAQLYAERASPASGTITFQTRFGRASTNGQVDINGVSGAQRFSSAKKSSLRIREVSNV